MGDTLVPISTPSFSPCKFELEKLWSFGATISFPKGMMLPLRSATPGYSLFESHFKLRRLPAPVFGTGPSSDPVIDGFSKYIRPFSGRQILDKFCNYISIQTNGIGFENNKLRIMNGFKLGDLDISPFFKFQLHEAIITDQLNTDRYDLFSRHQSAGYDNLLLLPFLADYLKVGVVIVGYRFCPFDENDEIYTIGNYFPPRFCQDDANSRIYFLCQRTRLDGSYLFFPVLQVTKNEYANLSFYNPVYQRRRRSLVHDNFGFYQGKQFCTVMQQRRYLVKTGLMTPAILCPEISQPLRRFSTIDHFLYRVSKDIPFLSPDSLATDASFQHFCYEGSVEQHYRGFLLPTDYSFYQGLTNSKYQYTLTNMHLTFEIHASRLTILVRPSTLFHKRRCLTSDWTKFTFSLAERCTRPGMRIGKPWRSSCHCCSNQASFMIIQNDRLLLYYNCDSSKSRDSQSDCLDWVDENIPAVGVHLRLIQANVRCKSAPELLDDADEVVEDYSKLKTLRQLFCSHIFDSGIETSLLNQRIVTICLENFLDPSKMPVLVLPDKCFNMIDRIFVERLQQQLGRLVVLLENSMDIEVPRVGFKCVLGKNLHTYIHTHSSAFYLTNESDRDDVLRSCFSTRRNHLEIYVARDSFGNMMDYDFKTVVMCLPGGVDLSQLIFGRKKYSDWALNRKSIYRNLIGIIQLDLITGSNDFRHLYHAALNFGFSSTSFKLLIATIFLDQILPRVSQINDINIGGFNDIRLVLRSLSHFFS